MTKYDLKGSIIFDNNNSSCNKKRHYYDLYYFDTHKIIFCFNHKGVMLFGLRQIYIVYLEKIKRQMEYKTKNSLTLQHDGS